SIMVDPDQLAEPTTQFVAGDDADAKQAVTGLLVGFGWQRDQVIDLGGLVAAREMESNILLWLRQVNALDTVTFNLRLVRGK
ncbi:MAG: NADPH-dependent F420 reductase, partial [Pseudonocardiaceae bacterium]